MEKLKKYENIKVREENNFIYKMEKGDTQQVVFSTKIDRSVKEMFDNKIIELKKNGYKVSKTTIINRLLKDFCEKTIIEKE
jgi:hypothetical protein